MNDGFEASAGVDWSGRGAEALTARLHVRAEIKQLPRRRVWRQCEDEMHAAAQPWVRRCGAGAIASRPSCVGGPGRQCAAREGRTCSPLSPSSSSSSVETASGLSPRMLAMTARHYTKCTHMSTCRVAPFWECSKTHTNTHTHTHTHTHTRTHAHMRTCTRTHPHSYTHTHSLRPLPSFKHLLWHRVLRNAPT